MKKTLQLLFTGLLFANVSFAQPTLQSTNLPNVYDNWAFRIVNDTTAAPGLAGQNITWDLSTYFISPAVFLEEFIPLDSSSDAEYLGADFKSANAVTGTDYWKRTASTVEYMGSKANQFSVFVSNVQNYLSVPLAYGNSISNQPVTGFALGFDVVGTVSAVGDGTGTLSLQGQTIQNCLRVKYDVDLLVGSSSGLDTYYRYVKYAWYKTGQRAPVFQILTLNIDGQLGTYRDKAVLVNTTLSTNVDENESIIFNLVPNPASSTVTVDCALMNTSNASVKIYDLTGRTVAQSSVNAAQKFVTFDLSNLTAGLYSVSVESNGIRKDQKLIVQ